MSDKRAPEKEKRFTKNLSSGPENVSWTGDCEHRPEIVKRKPVSNGGEREMLRGDVRLNLKDRAKKDVDPLAGILVT